MLFRYFLFPYFSIPSPSLSLSLSFATVKKSLIITANLQMSVTKQRNTRRLFRNAAREYTYRLLLGLNNTLKELLLVTTVASQTRGTMERQCCGNSYSAQRDLFIYTPPHVAIDHVHPQKRKLPTGGRY